MDTVENRLDTVETHLVEIDERFNTVETHLVEMDERFNAVEEHLGEQDERFNTIEKHLGEVDEKFHIVDRQMDTMQNQITLLIRKTAKIEKDLSGTKDIVSKIGNTLDNEVLPKLGALHDGYLQNKDITFRLATNIETESLENINT